MTLSPHTAVVIEGQVEMQLQQHGSVLAGTALADASFGDSQIEGFLATAGQFLTADGQSTQVPEDEASAFLMRKLDSQLNQAGDMAAFAKDASESQALMPFGFSLANDTGNSRSGRLTLNLGASTFYEIDARQASSVPEAGTFALACLGMVALMGTARKHRQASR